MFDKGDRRKFKRRNTFWELLLDSQLPKLVDKWFERSLLPAECLCDKRALDEFRQNRCNFMFQSHVLFSTVAASSGSSPGIVLAGAERPGQGKRVQVLGLNLTGLPGSGKRVRYSRFLRLDLTVSAKHFCDELLSKLVSIGRLWKNLGE